MGKRMFLEVSHIQVTNVCASYLPLLGLDARNIKGDGIVPLELGLMEKPANHVVVERSESCGRLVRHASKVFYLNGQIAFNK